MDDHIAEVRHGPDATRRTTRLAGVVYALFGITTLFGFFHMPLVRRDLTSIKSAIIGSDLRFQIGVAIDLVSSALGIPTALILYQLLKPVGKARARLMAGLLAAAMPISFVVALNYVAAHMLLRGTDLTAAFTDAQREALATLFLRLHTHGVLAEEIFWGLWLLPFGLLVMKSGFLPRVLGILLLIAGVANVTHSLTSMLLGGQRIAAFELVTMLGRAGELPIILWLLIKGADVRPPGQNPADVRTDAM
jgi:uncharacterized protein DUF4386